MIIIKQGKEILRTHLKSGSVSKMTDRYSSGIVIPLKGKMDFVFPDITISCHEGRGIFLPQGTSYQIICHECNENLLFNFIAEGDVDKPYPIDIFDIKPIKKLFDEAEREFLNSERSYNKIYSLLYQLFSELFDKKEYQDKGEKYVDTAERIILENISDPMLSCKFVAERVNVSEVYLRKLFVKYRSVSPLKYIQDMRMKKARIYLSDGHPVGETATNVGYSDIYQFSRIYKRYFGYAPSKTAQRNKI